MKSNHKTKTFTGLLLSVLLLVLGSVAVYAQEPIELRIAWWGSQNRHDLTIAAIELFEEQNPNITVTYEFAGWDDYWTRMTTQAAGGTLPDIMQQDYARITEWQSRGLIVPLNQYVESGVLNLEDVSEAAISGGRINGELYGVNLGVNSQMFVLDEGCFATAEIELPEADWTWEDFEQIALQLHEKAGAGMSMGLSNDQIWKALYLSSGEWAFNPEGTAVGYESDQPFVDYLNMILRLQEAGATITREQEVASSYTLESDPIVTNDACMTYMWSNQIIAMWNAAGIEDRNFSLVPLPRPVDAEQSPNYLKPSMFWSVTANSEHPEEAAKFIDFFTNSVEANQILMAERGVPISATVRDVLTPELNRAQAAMFDYIASIEETVSPIPQADPPGTGDIMTNVYYAQVVDPVLYGQLSAEEGAALLRQEANLILSENEE